MRVTAAKQGLLKRAWSWLRAEFIGDAGQPRLRASTSFHDSLVYRGQLAAARRDRTMDQWSPGRTSANGVHANNAALIRARARDLVYNVPMAESAVDAYVANVVECGIVPRPAPGGDLLSDEDRRAWIDAWDRWCEKEADASGQQHFYELLGLWLEETIIGGGCLTRYHTLTGSEMRNRSLPLTLELLDEDRFADNLDSFTRDQADADGRKQAGGSRIVRSVEIDRRFGRPLAYWLTREDPESTFTTNALERVRVPVDQCAYSFAKRRAGMVRGLSMFTPAVLYLHKLSYYLDNELTASAGKSSWMYMLLSADITGQGLIGDGDSVVDAYGNPLEFHQPGMVLKARPGDDLKAIGPNVPESDSLPWIEMLERSIAIAMHLSRSELCHDTGKSSFSAVRAERAGDRKRFTRMQWFTIWRLLAPTWQRFVESCVLRGVDRFPSASAFAANREAFLKATFSPPGWESVNPREDAEADALHIANRTKSISEIISYRGEDPREVLQQIADERKLMKELGIEPEPAAEREDEEAAEREEEVADAEA